ncbi:hypothetical protein [Methanosarcina horonobensis]|uniref:hypothetical protein n=1 Tax=Methanosarcina horonobensis TaxID=418008 RepID=UPI000AA027F1|nr:hypothetical protein [Methanosarcina horonobensis]
MEKALVANSYESLSSKLYKFQIKTFDFTTTVKLLISHYYSKNPNKAEIEDIKKLNQIIFRLYQREKSQSTNWQGPVVPLINKNNKIELANKLYFGKEYGNITTEAIYNYNKSKLVNSPKGYGIDESDFKTWNFYLKWLGVAEFPRKIQVEGTEEFAEYAMKHYNFKDPIDGQYFKDFSEFKNNLTLYSEIKVTSVDDLDLILINNSSENILSWLNSDSELLRQIDKDEESPTSKISFFLYRKINIRILQGLKFRNFLKWKLSNTAWLNTKSGVKQSPRLCTTSATIADELSPFIEKPNVDFDATIFRGNKIRRDKIDYLLNLVGVNKTISSFSTNTLYSILLKLPENDPEGKKSKVFLSGVIGKL